MSTVPRVLKLNTLQCIHKHGPGQQLKWPKHYPIGALTESASVSTVLHAQTA